MTTKYMITYRETREVNQDMGWTLKTETKTLVTKTNPITWFEEKQEDCFCDLGWDLTVLNVFESEEVEDET